MVVFPVEQACPGLGGRQLMGKAFTPHFIAA
ncbi:hypothetical protein ACVWWQ_000072 [Rhodanobacter sp. TND4EL1]